MSLTQHSLLSIANLLRKPPCKARVTRVFCVTISMAVCMGWAGGASSALSQVNETAPSSQPDKQDQSSTRDEQRPASPDDEIITDDAFATALPDLPDLPPGDSELGVELESIEAFERRFDAEKAGAAGDEPDSGRTDGGAAQQPTAEPTAEPTADSTGAPTAAELAESPEPLGYPFGDPEMATPLLPLESVADLPLDPMPDDQGPGADDPILRYAWRIEGLEQADARITFDLKGRFETLSTLEQGDGKAANIAMLAARLNDDAQLLQRILKAQGWYQAQAIVRLEPADEAGKVLTTAVIEVDPGTRFTLARIVVDAEPTVPEDLIERSLSVSPGDPIVASEILFSEAMISASLPQNGYPFASLGARDIALDAQRGDGVYTLRVDTGPRARFGGFAVNEDAVFDADHIADLARFEPGDLFDSRGLDDLRRALAATTLLRSFSVQPQPTGEDADDGTQLVTIKVDQTAGPARTLAGTVGYGTGQGFRVEGSWAHRNLFPPEGALTGSLVAGTLEQGAVLTFRRANAGQRDRTFEIGLSALRSNFEAFEAVTGRVGALYSYVSTPIWQKRVTYAFGIEALASVEEAFDLRTRAVTDQTYLIGALIAQVGFDTSDDLLNPTRGLRLEALVQPEGSFEGGFTPYVRTILDATGYLPAGDKVVLAGRARFGTLQGADGVDIAPSRRLYAGGGGSVRGFGFQQLGPRVRVPNINFDPDDPDETRDPFTFEPIGGRSVVEASAEARYRFGDYGVVAFVDAGQVYRDTAPGFSDIRLGVGIGGRVYTSFGPLRVDVATPLDRREGESRINVYVSIGQAF